MTILETFHITQLSVNIKDPEAGMFNAAAYHTETLYFKNRKLAKAYAEAKYPGSEYKTQKVSAVPDEVTGLWNILDYTRSILSIGQTFVMEGKYYQFTENLQGCLPDLGNWLIGLTAVPEQLTWLAKMGLFGRDKYNTVAGFKLEHASSIKNITHMLCEDTGLLYLAKARPQPVALVSHAEIVSLMSDISRQEKQVISEMDEIRQRVGYNVQWYGLNDKRTNLSMNGMYLLKAEKKEKKSAGGLHRTVPTDPEPRLNRI